MLPAKLPSKQLQVIWYSVINSIIHQWWSGKCYCLLPKYLYLTRTWLKKYLMSSKYSEYLNLYLYLQIWKSTCTWLKYFEKYLTPTLQSVLQNLYYLSPSGAIVTSQWGHLVACGAGIALDREYQCRSLYGLENWAFITNACTNAKDFTCSKLNWNDVPRFMLPAVFY